MPAYWRRPQYSLIRGTIVWPQDEAEPSAYTARVPYLSRRDVAHCAEVIRRRIAEDDCDGPEPVMTSRGYVDVWTDGDVVAFGRTVAKVEV